MNYHKKYSFKCPQIQQFSLPPNIIYYVNQNPVSPKCLKKLQQTCKYIFAKNKVVIVKDGKFSYDKWPTFKSSRDIQKIDHFNAKFWFTETVELFLCPNYQKSTKTICSKIYRCDINILYIKFMGINFREYTILTCSKKIKSVNIYYSSIFDDHQIDIPLDLILKQTPKVAMFKNYKPQETTQKTLITNETLETISSICAVDSIIQFNISRYILSPTVNLNLFCSFIKKCAALKASFGFNLLYSFPGQKQQFKAAIDQMLSDWKLDKTKPIIFIPENF